jgi:hypothetical protein
MSFSYIIIFFAYSLILLFVIYNHILFEDSISLNKFIIIFIFTPISSFLERNYSFVSTINLDTHLSSIFLVVGIGLTVSTIFIANFAWNYSLILYITSIFVLFTIVSISRTLQYSRDPSSSLKANLSWEWSFDANHLFLWELNWNWMVVTQMLMNHWSSFLQCHFRKSRVSKFKWGKNMLIIHIILGLAWLTLIRVFRVFRRIMFT